MTVPIPSPPLDDDDARRRSGAGSTRRTSASTRSGCDVAGELVTFRLAAYGTVAKPPLQEIAPAVRRRGAHGQPRPIDFDDRGRVEAAVYDRAALGAGRDDRGAGRDRGDGHDHARAGRHGRDRRPARQHHRPHERDLTWRPAPTTSDPFTIEVIKDALARRRRRDVRHAAAHLDEPDHLRGARLRERAHRRDGATRLRRARA